MKELFSMSKYLPYRSRSISPENFNGEKGAGGAATTGWAQKAAEELGQGWKVSPAINISSGETVTLAEINESGAIRHIWMTGYDIIWRFAILRFYWDDSPVPSVVCPLGDFFASAETDKLRPYSSQMTCVNPKNGMNCYWEMPFKKNCKITLENLSPEQMTLFYQIDYVLGEIPEDIGYFHARFCRSNPVPEKEVHTILPTVKGRGQYVGTYIYWTTRANDWWGEGEIKFYIDGDKQFPTICGTGTEDYFCGGDGFLSHDGTSYVEYDTNYTGFSTTKPDGVLHPQQRFSMYRWHIADPIYFSEELKVTIQALGWKNPRSLGYALLPEDISSVSFWYSNRLDDEQPSVLDRTKLEIF